MNIANIFLEKGKVIYSLDNKDGKVSYKDETNQKMDIKVIVLVNQNNEIFKEELLRYLDEGIRSNLSRKEE